MNQIPNIEETVNEFAVEWVNRDLDGNPDGRWEFIKEFLHHQLQKAREEIRQETMRKVMSKLRNQFNSEDDELSLEEIEVALYELDHSELDQDKV